MDTTDSLSGGIAGAEPAFAASGSKPLGKRSVGRPRRLTLDAIVDAACRVGIEQLEMTRVAERLETGVATLYGYVRSRDHLLDLVADRMASQALRDDFGGTWQEIVRGHAAFCFEMFKSRPEMVTNLVVGEKSDREMAYGANILTMLENRGLSREQAAELFVETNQAVIGAAVMLLRRPVVCHLAVENDPAGAQPGCFGDYRPTLDRIVRDLERRLR